MLKIRSYGAEQQSKFSTGNYIQNLPDAQSAICTIRQDVSKDKKTLKSIDYFAVGLTMAAVADFDFTIESVKVFDESNAMAKRPFKQNEMTDVIG